MTQQSQHKCSYTRGEVSAVQLQKQTLTSIASLSNMRSCRNSSSLILRSWKSSSIWDWASSSCCRTVSMWLIELLWGVLLLEMAESLFKAKRKREKKKKEKIALLKKTQHIIWMLYMMTKRKTVSDKVNASHITWKLSLYIFVNKSPNYVLVLDKALGN